jgi:hypothetical protein
MTITEGANELLMGGGGKTAKFPDIGDKVMGTVLAAEPGQQTDIDGKPLFWDDGKPRMQVVVSLQTDDREDDDDDGVRKLYVKGQMLKAVQEVVRPHKGLSVGGKLAVQYTGDGEQKTRGYNPPKLYKAQYEPPTKTVDLDNSGLF